MTDKIRWGILSTGHIAQKFARGLAALPHADLIAVGSRAQKTADVFGSAFDIPHRHPSYEALAEDPDVDVIYVATPHTLHHENTLLCLNAGKAVLCEKPFAINAQEAEAMITLAREKGLFLMEAMWSRFLPLLVKVRQLVNDGVLGEVRMLNADFGFRASVEPQGRLFDPELGGGALLDVGVYPISLASMLLGSPARVKSMAHLGEADVDEQNAILLGYEKGQLAMLWSAVRTTTHHEASIFGTEARLRMHAPWWRGEALTLSRQGQEDEGMALPFEANGYNYEAAEVMTCLREGKLESDVMPLDETWEIMKTLDTIREQWGLTYPTE
jgi:predicted dehydrogenase